MSMTNWAREEVRIACKRENPNWDGQSFDYGCSCYQSALEAYEVLMKAGHSGMSYGMTVGILKRLLEGKPLTPIEDTPDVWNECVGRRDGTKIYQCRRMSSLFKNVDKEGRVSYNDVERAIGIDENGVTFQSGLVDKIVEEKFPITMPYAPPLGTYKMKVAERTLGGPDVPGQYDTVVCSTLTTPTGEKIKVNRYFTEVGREKMEEITQKEYEELCEIKAKNQKENS